MIRDVAPPRSPALALVLGALIPAALLGPLVVVLERIGVPAAVLLGVVSGTVLLLALLGGSSGGTMRLPLFLTGGRSFGGFALGLAFGAVIPGLVPPAQAIPAALALAVVILAFAPALLRSGAVSLPTFLANRYGGRSLRLFAALLVAGAGTVLGASMLAKASAALAAAVPGGPTLAIVLCAGLPIAVLVPAGLRGLARAALVAACLLLIAAILVLGLRLGLPGGGGLPPVSSLAGGTASAIAAVAAAVLAMPFQGALTTAASGVPATREASIWGAIVTGLVAFASLPWAGSPPVFAGPASAVLAILSPLAAAMALLAAAGVALGYDLPGERDRARVSTSRRFAQLRLAMLAVCTGAAVLAARQTGPLGGVWAGFAEAALVAGVLPPVVLTMLRRSAGPGAGATAMLVGLAGAALAYDPRVWPGGSAPVSFALAGLAAGLAAGLLISLVAPKARPVTPRGDAAL